MTVDTFFGYVFWSVCLGIIFCTTVARMAINDNNEDPPERHPKLHTAGWFMVAFAAVCLLVFIIGMSQIDYPDEDPAGVPRLLRQNKTRPSQASTAFSCTYP